MNNVRRKRINNVITKLNTNKTIDDIRNEIEDILYEEEDAFDNMPEGLQYSMRGMESEDAIDSLNDALDCLDENDIDGAIDALQDIV